MSKNIAPSFDKAKQARAGYGQGYVNLTIEEPRTYRPEAEIVLNPKQTKKLGKRLIKMAKITKRAAKQLAEAQEAVAKAAANGKN